RLVPSGTSLGREVPEMFEGAGPNLILLRSNTLGLRIFEKDLRTMLAVTLPPFSDLHVHLRQGKLLETVVPFTDRCCAHALAMPNLPPPVTSPEGLTAYRETLRKHLSHTKPLMSFKLIATTTPEHVRALRAAGAVAGKLYPEGVTTNSEDGIGRNCLLRP